MNPQLLSLCSAWLRLSRSEWFAVLRLAGAAVVAALFALFVSGCVVQARPRGLVVRPVPPPVVVVTGAPRATEIVVVEAPPPPRREVIVERERPSPAHVWVRGYWRHDGLVYVWVPGHWERPPHAQLAWIEPRWERRGSGYVFIEGVWR